MDERLRNAERLYKSEPTHENLINLIQLRVRNGLDVDDLGEEAKKIAWPLQCKHPGLEYFQDESRYYEPEITDYITEKYHWYECFECGYREGGEGWKGPREEPRHTNDWNDLPQFRRNPSPDFDLNEIAYLGIFLTPQSKEKLKKIIPATFNQKSGDHITIVYEPTEEQIEGFTRFIGKKVVLTATHVVENDRIQAIRIKDVETERGTPHITISWADDASPIEANQLVATEHGEPIQPWLKLEGIYDVFPQSVEMKKNPPPYRRNADSELRRLERRYQVGEIDPDIYIAALRRAISLPEDSEPEIESDLEFQKTLVLSTGHITHEDSDAITAASDANLWTIVPHFDYGWWIHLPEEKEHWEEAETIFSPVVINVMAFAYGHGCQWLRLEADAEETDQLPVFAW